MYNVNVIRTILNGYSVTSYLSKISYRLAR